MDDLEMTQKYIARQLLNTQGYKVTFPSNDDNLFFKLNKRIFATKSEIAWFLGDVYPTKRNSFFNWKDLENFTSFMGIVIEEVKNEADV